MLSQVLMKIFNTISVFICEKQSGTLIQNELKKVIKMESNGISYVTFRTVIETRVVARLLHCQRVTRSCKEFHFQSNHPAAGASK